MKKTVVMLFAVLIAATGCTTTAVNKSYMINARGYAEIENGNTSEAKKEALKDAKENLIGSVHRFLEYKLPLDAELEQKIIYNSIVAGKGINRDVYYINLAYNLDLYNFVAKNCDFRNIYSWEILGLQEYYSDYINSKKPIGIWAKDMAAVNETKNPYLISSASFLPFFSGNFLLNKHMIGGFFTAAKCLTLAGAVLSDPKETEIRGWSWAGLGVVTILDIFSVFYETTAINEKLNMLQGAVLSDNFDLDIQILSKKF